MDAFSNITIVNTGLDAFSNITIVNTGLGSLNSIKRLTVLPTSTSNNDDTSSSLFSQGREECSPMIEYRHYFADTAINNTIYAFDGAHYNVSVEQFNINNYKMATSREQNDCTSRQTRSSDSWRIDIYTRWA